MPLAIGSLVGPYEIVSALGAGGMGEVYRAQDSRLGRDVAVKVLPASFADSPDRLKRFEQEARATGMLNHPNVLAVYDVGVHDGAPYLVTELLEGRTLREELPVSRRKALDWARQIATGLAAAHAKGITHRDLKPENLFITTDGRAKILDFGLAKLDESGEAIATRTAVTTPGVAMGTAGYMSPEQALGKPVDPRSDIFSFGAVLYEMLSGARAFHAPSSIETLNAILKTDPPPLADAALERIVRRCLEKSPDQRFQSASDLAFDLESQSGTSAGMATAAPGRKTGVVPRIAATAALALAAGVAAGLWWHAREDAAAPGWTAVRLGGPALVVNARVSPNGQSLAFSTEVDGQCQVGVMNPTSGDWNVVTRERNKGFAWKLSWSPDGAKIYFTRETGGSNSVFSVPALGGGDEQLVLEDAYGPEVLPDGSLIVARVNAERKPQLLHFWPQTQRVEPLAAGSENFRASPDGKVIVFFGRPQPSPKPEPADDYYVLDLSSNQVRHLSTPNPFGSMAVMPGSQSAALMSVVGDLARILEVPLNGGAARRLLDWSASGSTTMDAGPDGSLYLDNYDRPNDVLRFPASGGTPERVAGAPTGAGVGQQQVIEIADGRVIFPAVVAGRVRLLAARPGKDPHPFVQTDDDTGTPVVLVGTAALALQIRKPDDASSGMMAIASLSDGRIIRRFESTRGLNITGLDASPDGKTLYYTAAGSVWAIPATGGEPQKLVAGDSVAVDPNGLDLIVTRAEQDAARLFRIPLSGGAEHAIPFPEELRVAGTLVANSVNKDGRILVDVDSFGSCWERPAILDPKTGKVDFLNVPYSGDVWQPAWTADWRILAQGAQFRSTLWRFRREKK